MERPSIDTLHRTKTGKVSDKWSSYLRYYDALFASIRDNPIAMLEIGVQNGGSLETWSQYFNNAEIFVGCDIDPKCEGLRYDDPRIKVIVGDANILPTFKQILSTHPSYDIVIDDGSHASPDVLTSFVSYFPHVKPGGLYVVEDAHCLYMDHYGGGILNEHGAYAFFKRIADVTSFQFWKNDLSIPQYLRTFFDLKSTPSFITDGWIESIEFRNSIITIRKSLHPSHDKLGSRITTGQVALVEDWGGTKVPH